MIAVEFWRKTKRRRNTCLKRIDRSSPKRGSSNIGSPRLKPVVANKTVFDYSDLNHTINYVLNDLSNVTSYNTSSSSTFHHGTIQVKPILYRIHATSIVHFLFFTYYFIQNQQ